MAELAPLRTAMLPPPMAAAIRRGQSEGDFSGPGLCRAGASGQAAALLTPGPETNARQYHCRLLKTEARLRSKCRLHRRAKPAYQITDATEASRL